MAQEQVSIKILNAAYNDGGKNRFKELSSIQLELNLTAFRTIRDCLGDYIPQSGSLPAIIRCVELWKVLNEVRTIKK